MFAKIRFFKQLESFLFFIALVAYFHFDGLSSILNFVKMCRSQEGTVFLYIQHVINKNYYDNW
jgi:hypothetical protein